MPEQGWRARAAQGVSEQGVTEQGWRQACPNKGGGQQQRVAIARTLAARPALVLADEPTGNLDEDTAQTVLDLMLELVAEAGAGLLMVTHSIRLAERMDRQVHLRAGHIA